MHGNVLIILIFAVYHNMGCSANSFEDIRPNNSFISAFETTNNMALMTEYDA